MACISGQQQPRLRLRLLPTEFLLVLNPFPSTDQSPCKWSQPGAPVNRSVRDRLDWSHVLVPRGQWCRAKHQHQAGVWFTSQSAHHQRSRRAERS